MKKLLSILPLFLSTFASAELTQEQKRFAADLARLTLYEKRCRDLVMNKDLISAQFMDAGLTVEDIDPGAEFLEYLEQQTGVTDLILETGNDVMFCLLLIGMYGPDGSDIPNALMEL